MERTRYCSIATLIALVALVVVRTGAGAEPAMPIAPTASVSLVGSPQDIAMGSNQTLTGRVLDSTGKPVAGAIVRIDRRGVEVARTESGLDGTFTATALVGGLVEVRVQSPTGEGCHRLVRSWSAGTAPPSAQDSILIVVRQDVVRGQYGVGPLGKFATSPWVTAAAITAAIAVPIAVTHDAS